jgi:cytochrome c peroxidase
MQVGRYVKAGIQTALLCTCFFVVSGLRTTTSNVGLGNAVAYFKASSASYHQSALVLQQAIANLKPDDENSVRAAKIALRNSRKEFKKIEFFLSYFFESSALIYNRPAKVEVEEPYMEYQEPSGFQVIEVLLFDTDPAANQSRLLEQAELLSSSAADLNSLLYGFEANDSQVLESLRLELVRIITLSITGYDAPELKSGITESYQSLQSIAIILQPYYNLNQPLDSVLKARVQNTLRYLQGHPDFDSFNRMEFLTDYALPLQEQLRDFIISKHAELNDKTALNYKARNLFDQASLKPESFPGNIPAGNEMISLGKKLFMEKALSGNMQRNCASCHQPQRYFTDGIKTSIAFDGVKNVERNAPTLLYSVFQYSQFWDGRAKTLPEQIKDVIANPQEMNADHQTVVTRIGENKAYVKTFKNLFTVNGQSPATSVNPVTIDHVAEAIAAYVASLNPRSSPFDAYIAGDKTALSKAELRGANLFMGKGQCGTCHFAPLFNGLIPPYYKLTEYENLGTPANDDFAHLEKDVDKGRFRFFPISYYEAAFKTPTIRNAAMTAPYMHNGVFNNLTKVVEFYNQGGGAGLKMEQPSQTLSAKPLHLTDQEVQEIVVFMQSLTDKMN